MIPLSDDCFAPADRSPVSIPTILERILPRLSRMVDSEEVPLRAAVSRVLAEEVVSRIDVPGADNSAVDGYAVHFDDLDQREETSLAVIGRAAAGHALSGSVPRGAALRIFTGALMPAGPDTVIMQEDCQRHGELIVVPPGLKRGSNRRTAGEDVRAGTTVLPVGIRLRPQDVGLAAAIGRTHLRVARPLRVALLCLHEQDPAEPQKRSPAGASRLKLNRLGLHALLRQLGVAVSDLGSAPSDLRALEAALASTAASHDVLLAVNGVSAGGDSHVRTAIERRGSLHMWHLATETDCALAVGQLRGRDGGTFFIGLPEDAMGAMIGFLFIVRPILMRLVGRRDVALHSYRLRAGFEHLKESSLRAFLPARLERTEDGEPIAVDCSRKGGAGPSSILSADGVIEMPEELTRIEPGTMVEFFPFGEAGA
jgi:molybdopterin molybdotransferase